MNDVDFALIEFMSLNNGKFNQNEFPIKFRAYSSIHNAPISVINSTLSQFYQTDCARVVYTNGNQFVFISEKGLKLYNEEAERRFKEKSKAELEFELLQGQVKFQSLNNQAIERQLSLMEKQTEAFRLQTEIQKSMKQFTKFIVLLTVVLAAGAIVSSFLLLTQLLYQIRQGSGTWKVPYQLMLLPTSLLILVLWLLSKTRLYKSLLLILKENDEAT